jgi:hypothetical protein
MRTFPRKSSRDLVFEHRAFDRWMIEPDQFALDLEILFPAAGYPKPNDRPFDGADSDHDRLVVLVYRDCCWPRHPLRENAGHDTADLADELRVLGVRVVLQAACERSRLLLIHAA